MSAATDYLSQWIAKAQVRAPSITRVSTQRWPYQGTPPHYKPGIASYGWGINGRLVKDAAGSAVGLGFYDIHVWFSDRGLDLNHAPPDSGQQFLGSQSDGEQMFFTLAGDQVQLKVVSTTWHTEFTTLTAMYDDPSEQLVFSNMPAAGPDPVKSLLLVSLADTGEFAWL